MLFFCGLFTELVWGKCGFRCFSRRFGFDETVTYCVVTAFCLHAAAAVVGYLELHRGEPSTAAIRSEYSRPAAFCGLVLVSTMTKRRGRKRARIASPSPEATERHRICDDNQSPRTPSDSNGKPRPFSYVFVDCACFEQRREDGHRYHNLQRDCSEGGSQ